MISLSELAWPLPSLAEALKLLARRAGLKPENAATLPSDGVAEGASIQDIGLWLNWMCARIAVEAESVDAPWAELPNLIRNSTPALLKVTFSNRKSGVLLLLNSGSRSAALIGPNGKVHQVPIKLILSALVAEAASPVLRDNGELLNQAGVPIRQRSKKTKHKEQTHKTTQHKKGCWLLRMPPTKRFWSQLCYARVPHRLLAVSKKKTTKNKHKAQKW